MNTPVIDEGTGRTISDNTYIYWKNGNERMDRPGLQGGTMPIKIGPKAKLEPYGHASDDYQADPRFADYMTSPMGQLTGSFTGHRSKFSDGRRGGKGAFTPNSLPTLVCNRTKAR